jgi:hypothetical protein
VAARATVGTLATALLYAVPAAASAAQAAGLSASRLPVQVPSAGGANPVMAVPGQVPTFPMTLRGDENQFFIFKYISRQREVLEGDGLTVLLQLK